MPARAANNFRLSMTQPFSAPLFMPKAAPPPERGSSSAAAKEEPLRVRDRFGDCLSLTHLFSLTPIPQPPASVPEPEPVAESLAPAPLSPAATAEPPPSKHRDWGPGRLLQAIRREAEQARQAILRATGVLVQSKGGGSSGAPSARAASQSVAQLLEAHAAAVAQLHAALVEDPLFRPKQHDALWLLRFVLSHQADLPKAAAAARFTLRWRAEHGLDQIGDTVRARPVCEWPSASKIARVFPVHLCQPDPGRGPLVLLRAAEFDPDRRTRTRARARARARARTSSPGPHRAHHTPHVTSHRLPTRAAAAQPRAAAPPPPPSRQARPCGHQQAGRLRVRAAPDRVVAPGRRRSHA